jgi:hypothetical protein
LGKEETKSDTIWYPSCQSQVLLRRKGRGDAGSNFTKGDMQREGEISFPPKVPMLLVLLSPVGQQMPLSFFFFS